MKKRVDSLRVVVMGAVLCAAFIIFLTAVDNLDRDRSGEGGRRLEESLRRACAACYSVEGVYPPNLEYLTSRYGIQIDEKRYVVYYDAIGMNLMPDITVLERNP